MEKPSDEMIRKIIDSGIVHYVNCEGHERIDWDATEKALRRLFDPEKALDRARRLYAQYWKDFPENNGRPEGELVSNIKHAFEAAVREAGWWTEELVDKYGIDCFVARRREGIRKSPSEWLRDREGK